MASKFTLAQQQSIQDMHDYGLEQEIIELISKPELTPEQMNDLMWKGQSSYLLGVGDQDYDPEAEREEFEYRKEQIQDAVNEYLGIEQSKGVSGEKVQTLYIEDELNGEIEENNTENSLFSPLIDEGKINGTLKLTVVNKYITDMGLKAEQVADLLNELERQGIGVIDAYTPEQKAAYKAEKKADVKELTEQMEQGIKEVLESGQYKAYLDMLSKFHRYSYRNAMLIMMQKPDASLVAGFNSWKNDHERSVQKGEKGIKIFAPMKYAKKVEKEVVNKDTGLLVRDTKGNPVKREEKVEIVGYKIVNVFDVSQTKGKELAEPVKAQPLTSEFQGFEKMMSALHYTSPVPFRFESLKDGVNGYYDLEKKEIVICTGMSESQIVKTVIHEIAHAQLHDYDLKNPEQAQNRTDRFSAEVQAESVAYVVSGHFGLDTSEYSFAYAANWGSADMKEIKASMNLISNTSGKIIDKLDKGLERERTMERAQERLASTEKSYTVHEYKKEEGWVER